jgi:hypothetical protein
MLLGLFLGYLSSIHLVGKDALSAYCAYLELFLAEAIARAELAAKSENTFQAVGRASVEYEHLEKIFLQLLLDFQ